MRLTLRRKLILSIGVPLLLTYVGLLAWDYARQISAATTQMQDLAIERAQSAAATLDARLLSITQLAEFTASALNDRPNLTDNQLRAVMFGSLRQNPWAVASFVTFDPSASPAREEVGFVRRKGNRTPHVMDPGPSHAQLGWFNDLRNTRVPRWIAPNTDQRLTPESLCTYVVPITASDGAFRGALAVSMRTDELLKLRAFPRRDAGPPTTAPGTPGAPPEERDASGNPIGRRLGERLLDREGRDSPGERFGRNGREFDRPPPGDESSSTQPGRRDAFNAPATTNGAELLDRVARLPPPRPTTEPTEAETPEEAAVRPRDFFVIDVQGEVLATSDASIKTTGSVFDIAESRGIKAIAKAGRAALSGESGVVRVKGASDLIPASGKPSGYQWIAFAPIRSTGWAFAAALSESEIMDPILSRLLSRALFLLGGLVVIIGVVMLVAIRMSQPIERLAGAVKELARGNLDVRVTDIHSHDEIGQLARGFNHMVGELKSHIHALTTQSAARARADSEMRIARKIQTDLLPRNFTEQTEFDLFALNEPAAGVAGDFYDYFFTPSGKLMLIVADVAGKGVPAALMMAVTRTVIRDLAGTGFGCGEILDRANVALARDSSNAMFVTAFLAEYDAASGVVMFVNAGHPPPMVMCDSGTVRAIDAPSSALLGIFTGDHAEPYIVYTLTLAPGETLVMFSDGVTEARDGRDRQLGTNGFLAMLQAIDRAASAERICREIARGVDAYQNGQVSDDLTVLAIKRIA